MKIAEDTAPRVIPATSPPPSGFEELLPAVAGLVHELSELRAAAQAGINWRTLCGHGAAIILFYGGAGPDEFRTAPLWGVGQRVFFLHDGRTSNLVEAIEFHRSPGSEANKVIERFNRLSTAEKQDIINFLRSL